MIRRPDLDGRRLQRPGEPDVWLVFQGKRHRIVSPTAYCNLFDGTDTLTCAEDVDAIAVGPDLHDGTHLARPDGSLDIYLVTGTPPDGVRRHRIPNWETLCDFGFDAGKVRDVPAILLMAIPGGGDILSPRGRLLRG